MLVYENWWTERWCCRWSRCSHDLTQRRGQPPPMLHAQVLRGSVLVLAPGGTPGSTLFLRHGSAPASSSSATVLTLPLRTAAWRAEVPFWKTPVEMFGIKKAAKQRCLQRTNPQMRNNMEDVRSRKPDWFGEGASRLVDYKGSDVKCFNKSESQVHFTTLVSSFFFF